MVKHPRFHLHVKPISASWVNRIERFFREIITEEQIRRGVFYSVDNANPKTYRWTASPETILAKAAKANEKLGALH